MRINLSSIRWRYPLHFFIIGTIESYVVIVRSEHKTYYICRCIGKNKSLKVKKKLLTAEMMLDDTKQSYF